MRTLNALYYSIFLLLIITACSNTTYVEPKDMLNKNNVITQREFTTKDKRTHFTLHNEPGLRKEKIDKIMSEIEKSYEEIIPYSNGYKWKKNIDIYLKPQNFISYSKKDKVILYNIRGTNYQLTHELTHTLLGFGNIKKGDFNADYGYLMQEGFAVYLAERVFPEKQVFPNNGLDVHKVMKFLLDKNKATPIKVLANNSGSPTYFNSHNQIDIWKAYVQAGSFVKYLFETYKKEQVINLYNSPNLERDFKSIIGKDIESVENDWKSYIENNVDHLTEQDQYKVQYP